ncbi:DUF6602 domain-containing protein [Rhodoplanes sp. Z2-YC6860]|uniref:DUF6602 domain-containing protein n=1 Tax=Rhodoplanes sp. Z2-YC6860 TaxID=674703 RepID=UPI00078ECFE1|nr:DUF6602 domain-containing protein [Rhodoplanes sp. Z2-YC6860]AMN44725.1 hypothetical protein RHPLAN_63160 [Rhodoplanes sp. Z2-YC6860]
MNWSLTQLLSGLHDDIEHRLATARKSFAHAPTKGDASEHIWLDLLNTYLPERYRATTAHVVDSTGVFSEQIDVVIFDRQYSPLIFKYEGQDIIPAESVYAVFESKQTINAALVKYAREKSATVRSLVRTSLPIPHAGGVYEAKKPGPILAGILSFESDWSPALGDPLKTALSGGDASDILNIGCIASHGIFLSSKDEILLLPEKKPATAFLLELIARLQELATVPMIDVRAYARWLEK